MYSTVSGMITSSSQKYTSNGNLFFSLATLSAKFRQTVESLPPEKDTTTLSKLSNKYLNLSNAD